MGFHTHLSCSILSLRVSAQKGKSVLVDVGWALEKKKNEIGANAIKKGAFNARSWALYLVYI